MKKEKMQDIVLHQGDIVTYNPNSNLRTYGIVCNVREDGLVYIVPFTNAKSELQDIIYMPFDRNNDFKFFHSSIEEGTILLAVGRMVFKREVCAVIGACKEDFLKKVLKYIPMAVNFTGNLINYVEKVNDAESKRKEIYDSPVWDDPYDPHVLVRTDSNGTVTEILRTSITNEDY